MWVMTACDLTRLLREDDELFEAANQARSYVKESRKMKSRRVLLAFTQQDSEQLRVASYQAVIRRCDTEYFVAKTL